MSKQSHILTEQDFRKIVGRTNLYSASDLTNLCKDAGMLIIGLIALYTVAPDLIIGFLFSYGTVERFGCCRVGSGQSGGGPAGADEAF